MSVNNNSNPSVNFSLKESQNTDRMKTRVRMNILRTYAIQEAQSPWPLQSEYRYFEHKSVKQKPIDNTPLLSLHFEYFF